jgi:glycosyltransferase involved in cell wall biosynthesis
MRRSASLRILHVTPYSGRAWAYGGIARLAATLASGLARRGHQVTVCTTDVCDDRSRLAGRARAGRWQAWDAYTDTGGVTLRVFPNVSNRLAYHWQAFAPIGLSMFLRQHAREFDVAHLHACRNLPGVIASRHLARARVPYVVAPNGTAPRLERRLAAKRVFDAACGSRMLHHAARILAVSSAEETQLAAIGAEAARVRRIPNPLDLTEFDAPAARGRFRAAHGLSGPVVVFLGKITPRKRLDVLVHAYARLVQMNATLVIAGNDMGGLDGAMADARRLGIAERVRTVGLLAGSARLEALADADVVVYPSEHEIFGLVPLEALLCGTPVIVADDSGCGEVVQETGGGLVVPVGDVAALAAAIDLVLERQAQWRADATRAASVIRARFGCDTVCAQLEDVYAELVA